MHLSSKHHSWQNAKFWETASNEVGVCFSSRGVVDVARMGQGEPIVIAPGLAGGWRLVEPLARQLARSHEVILYGMAGDEGTRPAVTHHEVVDYALDLAELITTLRLERPTVLGVSFGGAVALQMAVDRPALVGQLVVSGMAARFASGLGLRIALQALEKYPLPPDSPFINQFFNLLHGGKPGPQDAPDLIVNRIWNTDQGVMASRLRALTRFDLSDRLWCVECPTLVVAGSRDVIVPPAQQRELARSIAGARFEMLADSGHIGFLTRRAAFGQQIRRVLRQRQGAAH